MRLLLRLAVLLVCFSASASAQLPFLPIQTRAAPPAGIALVAQASAQTVGFGVTITTSAIDTTGANFVVLSASGFELGSSAVVSDNKGNTFTIGHKADSTLTDSILYYVYAPTVGTGHTFTYDCNFCGGMFGTLNVAAFSGTAGSTMGTHSENGANGSATTIQPGSITPGSNNNLVVTGVSFGADSGGSTYTIGSGYTVATFLPWGPTGGADAQGGGIAYIVQTTATATNPTWTDSSSANGQAATIAAFQ